MQKRWIIAELAVSVSDSKFCGSGFESQLFLGFLWVFKLCPMLQNAYLHIGYVGHSKLSLGVNERVNDTFSMYAQLTDKLAQSQPG